MADRAVIYDRVSLDRRKRGRSVEQQEAENRAACAAQGWDVVAVFTDANRSASRYARREREDFQRLVAFLEAGNADVLVTWEASRSQRDLGTYVALRDVCMTAGVRWHYSGRTYDLSVPADRKATAQDAVAAEGYSDETSERVKRSTRAAAATGRPHGKHLYGFRRIYDPETRELVRVEEAPGEADVVREIARRVLAGEAPFTIARDLQRRGVPSPGGVRDWHQSTVRRLVLNPAYVAKRVHRGEVVGEAGWPPILREADWYEVRARLTDPTRRTTTRQGQLRHFLSFLARCGWTDADNVACDAPMKVLKNRGTLAYQCSAHFHVSRTIGQWRGWPRPEEWADRFDGVDDLVTCVALARLAQPDALDLLAADEDEDVRAALDQVRALRGRLDEFYAAAAAGKLSAAGLTRIEADLLPQIEAAERRARPRGLPRVVSELAGKADPAERWAGLTLAQRREVVDALMIVRILPVGRGNRRGFDPESVRIEWR